MRGRRTTLNKDEIITLLALIKLGGKAERYRILNEIGKGDLKTLLSVKDLEELESGNRDRYEANVSYASDHLKKKGYLRHPRYGVWEITDGGRKAIKEWFERESRE